MKGNYKRKNITKEIMKKTNIAKMEGKRINVS
jgi:hypothetical protein